MTKMNFENQTLDAVFKTSPNLAIPTYQRGYAWSQEQWEDFWEDLTEVLNEKEDDHFLGQVVTNTLDGLEYIVDGQQRITTTVIFLAVLRDQFKKLDNATAEVRADDIQGELIGRAGHYHLTQAEKSRDFFQSLIQEPNKFALVQQRAKTTTEKNFVKAYEYLANKIEEKLHPLTIEEDRLAFLQDVKRSLLDHMFVMKISTSDEASAFVIFETLNARGRDLNSSDLLKNHLFRKAKGGEDIRRGWDNMMEPLEYDSARATHFIRAYWNGTHGFVTEKKLYRELNHGVQSRNDALNLVQKLSELADDFAAMDDTNSESIYKNTPQLVENLKVLSLLSAKTFYPLMLVMADKNFDQDDMVKVTYKIISFTVRNFTIGGLVANQYEKMFSEIARSLYRGDISTVEEINAKIAENMIDDDRFSHAVQVASIKTEKAAKYVLSELAYEDEDALDLDDVKVVKIDENVENSDRIGNKLLITKLEAKEAKKSKKAKQNVIATAKFANTRAFADKMGDMSGDEIDRRQSKWVANALEVWSNK